MTNFYISLVGCLDFNGYFYSLFHCIYCFSSIYRIAYNIQFIYFTFDSFLNRLFQMVFS